MKKIILPMLVLCITMTLATSASAGSFEVNSDETVQIIGVYNKAGGPTNYVDLSGSPLAAKRAYEPDDYPDTYFNPETDGVYSLWDSWVASPTWDNGSLKDSFDFTTTGADWIWETPLAEGPTPGGDLYDADPSHSGRAVVFKKIFNIDNTWKPTYAELAIAADNCYEVWINGTHVARSATCVNDWQYSYMTQPFVDQDHWQEPGIYPNLSSFLKLGENTIEICAGNEYHGYVATDRLTPADSGIADVNNWPIPSLSESPYYQYNPGAMIFSLYVEYEEQVVLIPGIDVEKYVSDTICGCCNWDDADEPTGPMFLVGDDVYWLYLVTNTGEVPLTDVVLMDDNGTPDTSDDWEPWYLWGDVGHDGILGLDEVWVYLAKDKAIAGQYENWGYVEGWYDSTVVTDEDPANYYGQEQLEGCTPGFWKNNAGKWHASAWEFYNPCDSFYDVFGVEITIFKGGNPKKQSSYNDDPTLLQALGANGSGINLLARSAVAALLNAANPDVAYAMSEEDIIAAVQEAVDLGEDAIKYLGELLDDYNNAGCPLNQRGCPLFPTNCSSPQNKPNKPNKPCK